MARKALRYGFVFALIFCVLALLSVQAVHLHAAEHGQQHCQICSTPHLSGVLQHNVPLGNVQRAAEPLLVSGDESAVVLLSAFSLSIRPPPVN